MVTFLNHSVQNVSYMTQQRCIAAYRNDKWSRFKLSCRRARI